MEMPRRARSRSAGAGLHGDGGRVGRSDRVAAADVRVGRRGSAQHDAHDRRAVAYSLNTGANNTVSTIELASIRVTPFSAMARPFACTMDVETPDPCDGIACDTSSPFSATTRTRR